MVRMLWDSVDVRRYCSSFSLNHIILCIFCSFWVPDYESKEPTGSVSTNLGLLDKKYFSKITLRSLKAEYM